MHAFPFHSQFKRIPHLHEQGNIKMYYICIFRNKHIFKHFVSSLLTIWRTNLKKFQFRTCKHCKYLVLISDVTVTNEIVLIFLLLFACRRRKFVSQNEKCFNIIIFDVLLYGGKPLFRVQKMQNVKWMKKWNKAWNHDEGRKDKEEKMCNSEFYSVKWGTL